MNDYEKYLSYMMLPAAFLSKGFISGSTAPTCNYEEYMVELLDKSTYFRQRVEWEHIKLNEKQDHGQPDIYEDGLSLDLKLIGGQSAITARRHTSQSISLLAGGGIGYGLADGKKDSYEVVRIHLAFRDYSSKDLKALLTSYSKSDIIQRDIVQLLKTLMVEKNLLLFLPYVIFVEPVDERSTEEIIVEAIEDCFGSALEFRSDMVTTKETFFCFIHNHAMIFYQCIGNKLLCIDAVETYRSDTFRELARYYDLQPKIINAIIDKAHLWDSP